MLCMKYTPGNSGNICGLSHRNLIHNPRRIAEGDPFAHAFKDGEPETPKSTEDKDYELD